MIIINYWKGGNNIVRGYSPSSRWYVQKNRRARLLLRNYTTRMLIFESLDHNRLIALLRPCYAPRRPKVGHTRPSLAHFFFFTCFNFCWRKIDEVRIISFTAKISLPLSTQILLCESTPKPFPQYSVSIARAHPGRQKETLPHECNFLHSARTTQGKRGKQLHKNAHKREARIFDSCHCLIYKMPC